MGNWYKIRKQAQSVGGRYEDVVFIQGEEANEPLDILEEKGENAALEYLQQWHYPGEHSTRNELPHGAEDRTYDVDGYHMAWNPRIGYIGLVYDTEYANSPESFHDREHNEASVTAQAAPAAPTKTPGKTTPTKDPGKKISPFKAPNPAVKPDPKATEAPTKDPGVAPAKPTPTKDPGRKISPFKAPNPAVKPDPKARK